MMPLNKSVKSMAMAIEEANNKRILVETANLNKDKVKSTQSNKVAFGIAVDSDKNPQLMSEYVADIYDYLKELEPHFTPRPNCMSQQTEVTWKMRAILLDWIVLVHKRFNLLQETLFLTVNILDRYLSVAYTSRTNFQLVGVTSLWIAAKYEELYIPEISDFLYVTANAYGKSEMRQMECHIIRTIDYKLAAPLPIHFLRRFSIVAGATIEVHTMAKYLMELSLIEYDMGRYPPSKLAASSLYIAMQLFDETEWTSTLVYHSKYTTDDMAEVIRKLASFINPTRTKLTAVTRKYASLQNFHTSISERLNSPIVAQLAAFNQPSQ